MLTMEQVLPQYYGQVFGYANHYARTNNSKCGDVIPNVQWLRVNETPKPFRFSCNKKTCTKCGRKNNSRTLASRRLRFNKQVDSIEEWNEIWNTILHTNNYHYERHPAHSRWCLTLTLTGKGTYFRHRGCKEQVVFMNNALKTFYELAKVNGWKPVGTSKLETHHKGKWWHTHIHLDWMLEGLWDKHEGDKEEMLRDLKQLATSIGLGERIGVQCKKTNKEILEAWTNSKEYMGKSAWYLTKGAVDNDTDTRNRSEAELALKGINPIRFWGDKAHWEMINHNPDWKLGVTDTETVFSTEWYETNIIPNTEYLQTEEYSGQPVRLKDYW